MKIGRIHHVSLLVSDTQRALGFYRDLLGLQQSDARPGLGFPGAWLEFADGRQIHLLELDDTATGRDTRVPGGRDNHVALEVDDLDALKALLDRACITYISSRSGRRALFCRDPDGHAVEFVEVVDI